MFDTPLPPEQLHVSLLREQVCDVLREAIGTMRLKPGQRLVERELVAWTGVSRSTIRESIRQLAAEGLVRTVPQKGVVVAAPTLKEAEELYEIRSLLEGHAGRQFVERATTEQREDLRRSFHSLRQVEEESGDTWIMLEAKGHFYDALFAGAANRTIQDVLTGLQARITALRALSMSQPGRPAATVREIQAIVDAVEIGDAAAAERACAEHVRSAGRVVFDALVSSLQDKPEAM